MITIRNNESIVLNGGYSEYVIDSAEDISLSFIASEKSEVMVRIHNASSLKVETKTSETGDLTVLFWNDSLDSLHVTETHTVEGNLKIAYAEIEQAETVRNATVNLVKDGAEAKVSSAVLTGVKKDFTMKVSSLAPHTNGFMQNFAVVLNGGIYSMIATGEIVKGAVGSQSHQTSRALCFDEKINSKILPILLIDENDVQASHATSLGKVDEDQLYYMQTRGLTVKQCTGLISTGYLLPVTEVISDEELKLTLRNELERKISELCSM